MTPRVSLPSHKDVRTGLAQLEADADTTGRHPSVLALATRLGLANTTFRRHFPDIVQELTATPARSSAQSSGTTSYAQLKQDNTRLRRDNQDLAEHLELAIAHIQRLTLEAHQMRQQLEAATKITRIGPQPAMVNRPR